MNYRHEEEYVDDYNSRGGGAGGVIVARIIGVIIGALFLPSLLVGFVVYYVFLRTLRMRPRVSMLPLTGVFLILLAFSNTGLRNLGELFTSGVTLPVILSYLYLSLMIGIVLGFVYMVSKSLELRRNPELRHIRGWAYGFEYAPTPLERMRKKRNIESLRAGLEFDYEKAPIGVLDAPVKLGDLENSVDTKNSNAAAIVYRHYTEAKEHTLITGKTGSGKALHKDTKVPTSEGMKTVGTVNVGDTLYDENGEETKVIDKFQPMTPDHYEIEFDNGEIVKACGDHLWEVIANNKEEPHIVNTREMYENIESNDTKYGIKAAKNVNKCDKDIHEIVNIKTISDNVEDYYCFTVDSPSSLFLITDSYIPTHNTVTMLSLIYNDVLAGNPVCVIDFKKSPDFIYYLSKWAQENDREFYHFVSGKPGTYKNPFKDDQATYDPLSTGGATAKADMILNLRTWDASSEVFKKRTQDVLQSLFFLLERTPRSAVPGIDWDSGGLAQFVSALDLDNFRAMIEYMAKENQAGQLSPGDARRFRTLLELHKELSTPRQSDLKAQIVELLSIARTLIVSNYGDWLASGASPYHIDLMDIATDAENAPIVLFSFNQQEEPEFAEYIGSIVMSDLSRVSALKNAQGKTNPFGVYIDEFQTLDPATVKDNLEKARSSGMYITLSLQSIDQIVSSAQHQGEAMANSIIDTTANFIFHDGSGYDTAEKMSKIIGKSNRYMYKTTSKMSGSIFDFNFFNTRKAMVSKDIIEDWLIPPSEFQSLESPSAANGYKASAYVINKSPDDDRFQRSGGALARKVHVVVEDSIAEGVPDDFKRQIYVPPAETSDFNAMLQQTQIEYSSENEEQGGWIIEDLPNLDTLEKKPNNQSSQKKTKTSSSPYDDIIVQYEE